MDSFDVLIIGGGAAGVAVAVELREIRFAGSIALVTRELEEPYERPPVTKDLLRGVADPEQGLIVPSRWWLENEVELRTRAAAMSIDTDKRTVSFATKETVSYGSLVLATGAMVRRLRVDGSHLAGIHYLRAPANAKALRAELGTVEHVSIVGGSYVACETAASLADCGLRCTMVMQEAVPLERGFGIEVGTWVADGLAARGVELHGETDVARFDGEDRVEALVAEDGRRFAADLVIVGVGAQPDASLAKRAGIEIGAGGGILCDAHLRTSAQDVYAAGDVSEYESTLHGRTVRVEHHEHAAAQGRTVARNIAGVPAEHLEVPYFWMDLADWATLEYVGLGSAWDEVRIKGDLEDGRFLVRYEKDGKLVGALASGMSEGLVRARSELARHGGRLGAASPAGNGRGQGGAAARSPESFGLTRAAITATRSVLRKGPESDPTWTVHDRQ
jgi:3-phenylpropionate/trans-cinnamate dioxygenase ferredoxin reductase subunit